MRHAAGNLVGANAAHALPCLLLLFIAVVLSGCVASDVGNVGGSSIAGLPSIALQGPVGLPPNQTQTLGNSLADALQSRRVTLAPSSESPARFKLQGVCSASPGGGKTGIVCVWDLLSPNGQRAQRIVTEETINGAQPRSPWSVVSNDTLGQIAGSVAEKTAAWLPQAPASRTSGFRLPGLSGSSGRKTVSVSGVTGAPGSGNAELASALGNALRARNVVVATRGTSAYRVSAAVKVSRSGNEDTVAIDWQVSDANGATLGTISQRNRVARGSLNGGWGGVATGAADAAAKGVVELLP